MIGTNVAWGDFATIVGAVIAGFGAIGALIQYRQSKRVQRAEFLSTLARRFADEDVRSILASIDSEDRGESWFRNVEQDVDCRLKAEAVFSRSCKTQLQQTAARRQRMPELRRIA